MSFPDSTSSDDFPSLANMEDAVAILRSSYCSCDTVGAKLQAHRGAEGFEEVARWFADWLMFMEPKRHTVVRGNAVAVLRSVSVPLKSFFMGRVEAAIDERRIDQTTIAETARLFHASVFGFTEALRATIDREAPSILAMVHEIPDGKAIAAAAKGLRAVGSEVMASRGNDSFLGRLLSGGVPVGTALNIMIDSLEPIYLGMISLTWSWAQARRADADFRPSRAWLEEVLRRHPPFRYLSRLDGSGKLVMINVGMCNRGRQAGLGLTFGFGEHYCIGARIAQQGLLLFIESLACAADDLRVVAVKGAWRESGGTGGVDGLVVELNA